MADYANYHVGLKALLRKGDEVLVLYSPQRASWDGRLWDFAGGRINTNEYEVGLEDILQREIAEELGNKVRYRLGNPIFVCRRFITHKNWNVFLVFYDVEYLGGEIQLSEEHTGYEWVNIREVDLDPQDFVSEEEYRAFVKFFAKDGVGV